MLTVDDGDEFAIVAWLLKLDIGDATDWPSPRLFKILLPLISRPVSGFTCTPLAINSKCKCGPVESPVEPTSPITSPTLT